MRVNAVVALILVITAFSERSSTQTADARPFVPGEILVKFQPGAPAATRADAHRLAGAAPDVEIARTRVQRVRVPAGAETVFMERYRRNPNVLYAEPNFVRTLPTPLAVGPGNGVVAGDTHFDEQWGLHSTGQEFYCIPWIGGDLCLFGGTPDADIDAPEAWEITTGSPAVTVAVIDSGIDYTHPDLAPNYAGGADFVSFDGDPMDDHGHGTHVAGTIAAALNNLTGTPAQAEGVAGVAPNARLLAYKVCRADGTCDDFAIQQAIARAIVEGANVINMSLGQSAYSQSLDDAVQDAWNAGLVIVAGAGNDGVTAPFYPAAFDNVISVAAFDADHQRASFSNYGSWVDLSAPGDIIMSTYPLSTCGGSTIPGDTGCYAWLSGTSMATPHVSGAAALVWSRSDVTSNSQVVDILLHSADRQGVAAVALDSWTIHGGLNLHDAVTYSTTNPTARAGADQTVMDADEDGVETVMLDGGASSDPDGTIVSYTWREDGTVVAGSATASIQLAVGVHALTLEVVDNDGNSASDSVVVTVRAVPADLIVTSVSGPAASGAGLDVIVTDTTRNQGAGSSTTASTAFYLSRDSTLDATDVLLGSRTVPALEPGTSHVASTTLHLPASTVAGSYRVLAKADAGNAVEESVETNNTKSSGALKIGPDLVVSAITAPATLAAGATFTVSETTKNQASGSAAGSTTRFFLSANASLDAADVILGSRVVAALAPGASETAITSLSVPAAVSAGTYYVLAQADAASVVPETSESNNVNESSSIKIGPDLILTTVSAPASAVAGGTITVTGITKNQGAGAAAASATGFYLSDNAGFDATDVFLGAGGVSDLAAGGVATASTSVQIPASVAPGSYYIVGRADWNSVVQETSESNNHKPSAAIKIGGDLVLTAVAAPATARATGAITVTDTTKNQGVAPVPQSATGFYLSPDSSYDATDVPLGSRVVPALGVAATHAAATLLTIPAGTAPGTYYVVAVADMNGAVAEISESNNSRSDMVRIGPDLTVPTLTVPSSGIAGTTLSVSDIASNQGGDSAPGSLTSYYLSTNSLLNASDVPLGSRPVPALAPGSSHAGSVSLLIPAATAPGTYYIIARADGGDGIAESLETNNVRAKSITIAAAP
jgi:subtilisin family serine protease/subtilase family serine protease